MKQIIICVFTVVFAVGTQFSQNLIPNSNFESLFECPSLDNSEELNIVASWYNANTGTCDVFNNCSSFILLTIPSNIGGFQHDNFGGQGYVGHYVYSSGASNVREYLQTQLVNPLNPCSIYKASFYVSPAESFRYGVNSIGAFVGDSAIHRNDYGCFSYYEPQIQNKKTRFLSDTLNWTKIEGLFIADGGEQYITIGNFSLDSDLDTVVISNSNNWQSYYYIDNVSLTLFSDANTNIIAGNDTIVAPGDSIFIGQEIKGLNCTWRLLDGTFIADSISGIYVQPAETTTYVVEQNLCGTITYDTVTVFVNPVGLKEPMASSDSASGIVIFPNPNNGSFEIQNPSEEKLVFELKNALGQVVYQEKIITEKQSFDPITIGLRLERGVYFATFNTAHGKFEEKIVIK
jgi:hypothetical protein